MVDKLRNASLDVLPYFEITMKPADVRPITLSMMETSGRVKISPGTADDMAELLGVLGMMRQVVQAALNVRMMAEASGIAAKVIVEEDGEEPSEEDGSLPF